MKCGGLGGDFLDVVVVRSAFSGAASGGGDGGVVFVMIESGGVAGRRG